MGKSCRIDDNKRGVCTAGLVNLVNEFVFGVTLKTLRIVAVGRGQTVQSLVNVDQTVLPVMLWFPRAQKIEVGPV
jgi:hypothetical protein